MKKKAKHPGGRPTKFTPPTCARIVRAVSQGIPLTLATLSAGVSYHAFREWMIKGQHEKEGPYREFFERIRKAEGKCVEKRFRDIEAASKKGDWRASYALLRLRYPKLFGNLATQQQVTERITFEDQLNKIRIERERQITITSEPDDLDHDALDGADVDPEVIDMEDPIEPTHELPGPNGNGNGHA